MTTIAGQAEELMQLRQMRAASAIEGTTLLLLLAIAVPLKHLAGLPIAVAIMGPVHGIAFIFYFWTLIQTAPGGNFSRAETVRMILAAFVPFGGLISERALARRQASLATSI